MQLKIKKVLISNFKKASNSNNQKKYIVTLTTIKQAV